MATRKPSGRRKYGKAASKRVEIAMRRRKKGTLKSGRSGRTVKSRKQAIAQVCPKRERKAQRSLAILLDERPRAEENSRAADTLSLS